MASSGVRIGVVVDGPWEGNGAMRDLTVTETLALTEGEFDVRFPEEHYLVGDWTYETARGNVQRLLDDADVDLIITWGLLASHAVCCYANLPKPVIAPAVADKELQGMPFAGGASGVSNLTYVSLERKLDIELQIFREIVPFSKIAFLSNDELIRAVPEINQRAARQVAEAGFAVEFIGVGSSAEEALDAISEETDAVYVWPLFQMPPEEFQKLIEGLAARRLPSFSGWGSTDVESGLLATATPDHFFPHLVRRVALNVQRILLGEEPGSIPVGFTCGQAVVINMETARAIEVSPGWDVLAEARLLHPERADLPSMSLPQAVLEAVEANLDLLARQRAVEAGQQEVEKARSSYLPRLEVSASGLVIDDDRAAASLGSQAERTTSGSLDLSQLIYSDGVLAGIEIERQLQDDREQQLEVARLDTTLEAAVTYLNLLRAKSLVRIQRDNLELTRSNLELAETRRSVGAANPAEVLRWESQIAIDRQALNTAMANRQVAEIALNRLLHRDLETRFVTEEVGLDDPSLVTSEERFRRFTATPRSFRMLRDFIVQEGMTAAPELKRFDALLRAQERRLQAARRAYWIPTVGLQASLNEIFSKGGEGSDPSFSMLPFALPLADDTSWSLGLGASLPLYQGGARAAEQVQAELDLRSLKLEFDSTAEKIEQSIRAGMQVTRASFAGIDLSRQAWEAAEESRELVADAYARGAVSIIDLLDAQRNALSAEQLVANSTYDFFIDLMEVHRAANRFNIFLDPRARDLWYERLELYFAMATGDAIDEED